MQDHHFPQPNFWRESVGKSLVKSQVGFNVINSIIRLSRSRKPPQHVLPTTSSEPFASCDPSLGISRQSIRSVIPIYRRRWLWEIARQRSQSKRFSSSRVHRGMQDDDLKQAVDNTAQDPDTVQATEHSGRSIALSYQNNIQVSCLKLARQPVLASSSRNLQFLTSILISLSIFTMAGSGVPTPTVWCVECEDVAASVFCESCRDHFCGLCFQWQHRSGNRASHVGKPLPGNLAAELVGYAVY
jgi:hypothetical protein